MAGLRAPLGITSLVLIAGSIVLIFFVVLSGLTNTTPLNKTYFLQADTSSIGGARSTSQWTFFYVCGADNQNCGKAVPDLPFGYAWVGDSTGAPSSLVGSHAKHTTSKLYYYLWRFGWVFYLMGLFFDVLAFFAALAAPFSRLVSGLSGLILASGLFFFTLGAALMTATFVKAHDAFKHAGMSSKIGRYAFGFTWGAWFAMAIATGLLFAGVLAGGRDRSTATSATATRSAGGGSSRGFFRRQRSRQSARGSFVENESQRRVKDEYA